WTKTFAEIVEKEDWSRLLRLLALVLSLSGVILGIKVGISGSITDTSAMLASSRPAVVALVVGVMLSVFYNGIAYVFGIKLPLNKSVFLVLCLGLPWVPIFSLLQMLKLLQIDFPLIGLAYILGHFVFIKPVVNFYFGVKEITSSPNWRILASILSPLLLIV